MITPAKILSGAADLLESRGHTKGRYVRDDGSLCAVGAMRVAAGLGANTTRPGEEHTLECICYRIAYFRLLDAVGAHDVADWNDEEWTTAAEVIAALRFTAESVDRAERSENQSVGALSEKGPTEK